MVAGKYKDTGNPFRELKPNERTSLQNTLDLMHEYFIQSVAENRNMSIEDVRKIANGKFYLGLEAKELGLVDFIGGKEVAEEIIKKRKGLDEVKLVEYKTKTTLFNSLTGVFNSAGFSFGQGFAKGLVKQDSLVRT